MAAALQRQQGGARAGRTACSSFNHGGPNPGEARGPYSRRHLATRPLTRARAGLRRRSIPAQGDWGAKVYRTGACGAASWRSWAPGVQLRRDGVLLLPCCPVAGSRAADADPHTQKPFYNQSTEIHATLKESLTAMEPQLFSNGSLPSGFVPGRPVLEVPGWRDRYPQPAATAQVMSSLSRLRIFSGTSNPVSAHSVPGAAAAGAAGRRWHLHQWRTLQPRTHVCALQRLSHTPPHAQHAAQPP